MTEYQLAKAVRQMLPRFKTDDPQDVLLKYARENKLAPAVLERLGQISNCSMTLDEMNRGQIGKRATEVNLIDIPAMLAAYQDFSTSKQASAVAPSYELSQFSVGNLFRPDLQASKQAAAESERINLEPAKSAQQILHEREVIQHDLATLKLARAQIAGELYSAVSAMAEKVASLDKRHLLPDLFADVALQSNHPTEVELAMRNHMRGTRGWVLHDDQIEKVASAKKFTVDHMKIAKLVERADDAVMSLRVCDEMISEQKRKLANALTDQEEKLQPGGEKAFLDQTEASKKQVEAQLGAGAVQDPWNRPKGVDSASDTATAATGAYLTGDKVNPETPPDDKQPGETAAEEKPEYGKTPEGAAKANAKEMAARVDLALKKLDVKGNLQMPTSALAYLNDTPAQRESELGAQVESLVNAGGEAARTGNILLDGTRNIFQELSSADPAGQAMRTADKYKAMAGYDQDERQNRVRSAVQLLQHRTVLARLLATDDVLSKQDPATVAAAFETLRQRAPGLAADINGARPILREALQYQGVPLSSFKTMQEIGRTPSTSTPAK